MDTVIAVYKTDAHHSYASRDLIGLGSSFDHAIKIVRKQIDKEIEHLEADQLFNLRNIKQTQGYSGEGEFHMEELALDTLF